MPLAPFGISGLPFGGLGVFILTFWKAILVPRDHPAGPWEQQDGHEVVRNMMFIDFGVILGPVKISFLIARSLRFHFLFGLVSRLLFY